MIEVDLFIKGSFLRLSSGFTSSDARKIGIRYAVYFFVHDEVLSHLGR